MSSKTLDLEIFLDKLERTPELVEFPDTIGLIDKLYEFTPVGFRNGNIYNEAGQNAGSCKLFAFARLHDFSLEQTLACFGAFYRSDVLRNPKGDSHPNIRAFMKYRWEGIEFDGIPLKAR